MPYPYWWCVCTDTTLPLGADPLYRQNFELYNHVQAGQLQATADDDQSTQQNYYLPSAPVYGMHSMSNDQVLAPVGLYDAVPPQSNDSGPLPNDVSSPSPHLDQQIDQPNIHSAAGQPSNDGFPTQIPCLWTDHQGQCGISADTTKSILAHISLQHLPKKQPSASRVQCHICSPAKTFRKDTIRRHIGEIHYEYKCRRRHS
ncbi:hypothetical protein DFJ58DRAFT_795305, partial [Suillus subalutaceus]|uniref:uncharacterized protein n=1 Tax=Suillus subalutaceus TaxID=48586 RepID=UPI001B86C366